LLACSVRNARETQSTQSILLDTWIETAEDIIEPAATVIQDVEALKPLPELLSILRMMRRHRDEVLQEAGYAGVCDPARREFLVVD
jgi:hypothetical protein